MTHPSTNGRSNGAAHKSLNLALQGGGSHGAFTWGVLDCMLEDGRIAIEGVSGTSAGAMNGAMLAQGYSQGGAEGAREALDTFWRRVASLSWMSPVHRTLFDKMSGNWNTDRSPGFLAFELLSNAVSPYDTNPANFHPLRGILADLVDFERIQKADPIKLFISATNVRTGQGRVFSGRALTLDAVLASACLPTNFQAVEIEGDPYWDGGYVGNPAIHPLIYECDCRDVAVIQINPLERPGTPRSSAEIMNRLNEITFNSSLMAEMRAIAFVQKLIDDDHLKGSIVDRLKKIHIHMVRSEEAMRDLGVSSKYNSDLEFVLHLKEMGRAAGADWLERNYGAIGRRSSIDIRATFLGGYGSSTPEGPEAGSITEVSEPPHPPA